MPLPSKLCGGNIMQSTCIPILVALYSTYMHDAPVRLCTCINVENMYNIRLQDPTVGQEPTVIQLCCCRYQFCVLLIFTSRKALSTEGSSPKIYPMQSAIEAIHLKFTIEPSLVEIAAIGGILAQALRASGAVADVERDRRTSDSELPNADRNRLTAGNEFTILFTSSMVNIPPFLLNNSI